MVVIKFYVLLFHDVFEVGLEQGYIQFVQFQKYNYCG